MSHARVEWAALVLRIGLGVVMLAHGLAKIFIFTMAGTVAFFEGAGYPGLLAYPVTAIEVIGGVLLVLGFRTRWAALAMVPVLLGATSVHLGNGWMFNAPEGGWEYPLFLAVIAFGQFVLGADGALSVSSWLEAQRPNRGGEAVTAAA
jgi:putative oxidoreductase